MSDPVAALAERVLKRAAAAGVKAGHGGIVYGRAPLNPLG